MSVSAGFVQRVLDQSADGCVVFDARGLLLYANDAAKAFIAEGTTFAEVLPGAGSLDEPAPEFHCPKHKRWIELVAIRVGELHVFTLRDVSSRVVARREAERATKQLRFISDASAVFSTALDAEQTLQRVAQLAVPFLADACVVDPPGALVTESHRLVVPLMTAARPIGALTLTREQAREPFDVEDLRVAQELAGRASIAIHNAQLYATLEQQRADMEQLYEESRRAQRELTESVRVRDDFLAIAGHELKTPLTTARLQLGMLLRSELPERAARHADSLVRQCERLMRLVEGLLDVSRIVAGKLSLQPQEIDLARLVTETATRQAADNAASAIRVVAPESVMGKWDPLRVEQVVQNLLSNAVKYGAGNPVEVSLEAMDGFATVRVRDRGIGIAPGDHRRIFERFERAAPARNYGGLGLGLWICRELTEAMGGQISVESRPGEGSTFAVRLPCA